MEVTKKPKVDESNSERFRFLVELEFVQCLANPYYLQCERLPSFIFVWFFLFFSAPSKQLFFFFN
jgi:hypothetical protein